MAHFPPAVLAHFARCHGIAGTQQLRDLGMSDHLIRSMREAGNLERVVEGVYRLPAIPLDEYARCVAMSVRHQDATISGPTAGRLWGFRRLPSDQRIHLIVSPASQHCVESWVRQYRTAAIHEHDRVFRPDGIVVTSRARTALDLARVLDGPSLLSVIEQAAADGGLTRQELRAVAVDWLSPQRPWLRRYLELVNRRLPGGPAESHAEVRVGDLMRRRSISGLERQYSIDLPGYGPARFDLAVPSLCWAIEIDLFPTHRETIGRRADEHRDRCAATVGWSVTRLGTADLDVTDGALGTRLLGEYRRRRAARHPVDRR
ncbi:MAG: type IV toxin-antitoxin system AbiEi family antitoxin domain-containing protein [Ilumatobacter sp.]|uniref:type IV toxin-antitoxin system AbiEi family antitoxin domain-containing protein n=1 Tax=Ilumatobacter sp. TaxID=1967498 RepID=UPI00391D77B4